MDRIVVGTDFSPRSTRATKRAALLAHQTGARVDLVHVLARGPMTAWLGPSEGEAAAYEHASNALDAHARLLAAESQVQARGMIVYGPRADALVDAGVDAGLLVVGASQPKRWFDPFPGWLHRLLRRTSVPVLIVREACAMPYRRVLAAVDLVTPHERALRVARTIAPGARFHVIHAFRTAFENRMQLAGVPAAEIADYRGAALQEAVSRLADSLVAFRRYPNLTAHVVHDNAGNVVVDKAAELHADLVVVCRSTRSLVEAWLAPGVTARLLDEATADVLVVPS